MSYWIPAFAGMTWKIKYLRPLHPRSAEIGRWSEALGHDVLGLSPADRNRDLCRFDRRGEAHAELVAAGPGDLAHHNARPRQGHLDPLPGVDRMFGFGAKTACRDIPDTDIDHCTVWKAHAADQKSAEPDFAHGRFSAGARRLPLIGLPAIDAMLHDFGKFLEA
jgi:hypothetical protein